MNEYKELYEREQELKINKQNLPQSAPGDDLKPRTSQNGHRRLIAEHKAQLLEKEKELRELEEKADNLRKQLEEAKKAAKEAADRAAREAAERAKKEAAEKGKKAGGGIVKKIVKKGSKTAISKIPVVAPVFFIYDWSQEGFGYAVDEATWPVSELWSE